jgi:NAD(P)-dependent dehydrogenase (short-subunit alcohol dehydrogenase family)
MVVEPSIGNLILNLNVTYRYKRLDFLYCNAGFLSASGIKWGEVITIFLRNPVRFIESSDSTQQIVGEINDDNVGLVFASNVLGHYFMVRELEPLLKASGDGRVIWTSSGTASSSTFSVDDWQGVKAYVMKMNTDLDWMN